MANRTVKDAKSIKGTNPQYLIEKIIRSRIYDSKYWKEECFALTAELLVDKAMELKFIGGVFGGNIKPTPFLCLILKMLQIQPEKEIIVEFIRNEEFKYVRALGAYYMRLTGTSLDCYNYLEPLLNDFRKLRRQSREGAFELTHVDEFVDDLLREERALDVILPRIQKRSILEETNVLMPRTSVLDEDDDDDEEDLDLDEPKDEDKKKETKPSSKSSKHPHKDDRRKRRGHSSDTDSSDGRRRKNDRDRERERRDSRDDKSYRKDKRREADSSHDKDRRDRDRDRDRDRNDRSRFRDEREKDRGDRDYGRSRDSEKDRHYHRDRESDRHRSSRRYD